MKRLIKFSLLLCYCLIEINGLKLPGPLVYVVTPSPKPPKNDEGRSAPFYYHSWMRRMDSPLNATTATNTTPKTKTPDLIFAEFESGDDNMKSIRKLLERERIQPKTTTTTTTSQPIYVPDEDADDVTRVVNYGLPVITENKETKPPSDSNDYFSMYNALYNKDQAPVYLPAVTDPTNTSTSPPSTATPPPVNVENIWHIIDNEKYNQYSGKWEQQPIANENSQEFTGEEKKQKGTENSEQENNDGENVPVDENFALPGFGTNPGNGAENESRAIRTEPNIRFPYVNLKPFQIKNQKKPFNSFSNSKKSNNMFTSLDNFRDVKNPVRGEAQDIFPIRQPIDRYNPAQPYLPQPDYGGHSKQSSKPTAPVKATANLVPPPPPPLPKLTDNDFPVPDNYDSFPPYAPAQSAPAPPTAAPALPPPPPPTSAPKPVLSMYQPPVYDSSDDSGSDSPPSDDNDAPMDVGYRYKQPSSQFLPTLPPLHKPFGGYSYDKPSLTLDTPPAMDDKPNYQNYHYSKPEPPAPSHDQPPPSYGHYGPSYHHDSDYPDLIFNKPHAGMGDTKDTDDTKDAGMSPPPPPDAKPDHGPPMDSDPPMDDHGFPHDFPGDLKFHHDIDDDHDYHHYHHHPTTTTTTEQPRVNRYSYYYLGKKLYYLPLYFSVYFIVYVGALIIKAVLRHKIVYPNSWRPNDMTASYFSKRSVDSWDMSHENLHEITGRVTHAIATAAQKYMSDKNTE